MDAIQKIDSYLASLPQWQKENLITFRKLVHSADSSIQEDWKWNVPVFLLNSRMIFAMSAFKAHTKYNFILNGAQLSDPDKLFNNGFESKKSRGIDLKENYKIDTAKLLSLIKQSLKLK
jgi:hypothetical protein